jgi:ADP-ribosyl-[dinitrogen reductase] hydrolase
MTTEQDRYRGALLGLACGDALGSAVGSAARGSFAHIEELSDGGADRLPATAQALRLAHGLLETGAIEAPRADGGSGGLLRLAPLPMYYALDGAVAVWHAEQFTRALRDDQEEVDCARLFAWQLCSALQGKSKDFILTANVPGQLGAQAQALAQGEYMRKTAEQLKASGAPAAALEAALWCFWHTTSFKQAVLTAANLGDGADTTAPLVGQLAGAYYGVQDIPGDWLEKLAFEEELLNVADSLLTKRAVAG